MAGADAAEAGDADCGDDDDDCNCTDEAATVGAVSGCCCCCCCGCCCSGCGAKRNEFWFVMCATGLKYMDLCACAVGTDEESRGGA